MKFNEATCILIHGMAIRDMLFELESSDVYVLQFIYYTVMRPGRPARALEWSSTTTMLYIIAHT